MQSSLPPPSPSPATCTCTRCCGTGGTSARRPIRWLDTSRHICKYVRSSMWRDVCSHLIGRHANVVESGGGGGGGGRGGGGERCSAIMMQCIHFLLLIFPIYL